MPSTEQTPTTFWARIDRYLPNNWNLLMSVIYWTSHKTALNNQIPKILQVDHRTYRLYTIQNYINHSSSKLCNTY